MKLHKQNNKSYMHWVKRLRQAHLSEGGSRTLCGMPMLGSNYAELYSEADWNLCDKCYTIIEEVDYETETK